MTPFSLQCRYSGSLLCRTFFGQIAAKAALPTHYCLEPRAGLLEPSMALMEQIRTIDKQRLGRKLGRLSEEHIHGIDQAIKISLGLIEVPENMVQKKNSVHTATGAGALITK